jgi:hypothetical protein
MLGMVFGFVFNVYLWMCTAVAFTWYVVMGSAATFMVGYGASWLMPRTSSQQPSFQSPPGAQQ